MDRDYLISLCEKAIVKQDNWTDRDSASSQVQIGKAWALLKANCDYKAIQQNEQIIDLTIEYKGFSYFEMLDMEKDYFYIPTEKLLEKMNGKDWY